MISEDKITKIAGLLLAELNIILENAARKGNENIWSIAEATIIERLDNGAETGRIAEEIMKVMFPGKKNRSLVTVGYDKKTLKIKAIVDLKKE